jgi:epoxyqueuosine reductase
MTTSTEELTDVGRRAGLDAVGVARAEPFATTRRHLEERRAAGLHGGMAFTYRNPARSTNPAATLPGARSLVVGAKGYGAPQPPPPDGPAGRVARYAWTDHYAVLRDALSAVAAQLKSDGWRAVVVADDNSLVDREAAYRAGLGWYGKNANLLLPGRGSWFVLGAVITDASLEPAPAPTADGCGACRRCLDGCPTGAIVAPGVVDARRCLAWLVQQAGPFPIEHRAALGDRIYGCDDCQEVCPPNRVALRTGASQASSTDAPLEAWVPLVDLLQASDAELLARHGRWYIAGRDPRWLRRNALVALGNVGDGADPRVVGVLARAIAGPDPILREHAVWAAQRLRLPDVVALAPGS